MRQITKLVAIYFDILRLKVTLALDSRLKTHDSRRHWSSAPFDFS
jgi:hypothetical protein